MKKYLLIIVLSLLSLPSAVSSQTAGDLGARNNNSTTTQTSFQKLFNQAQDNYNIGEYATAVQLLERALKIEPKNAQAHYRLGSCYYELANYKKAIEAYRQALNLKPDYYEAAVYLGNSLDYDGQFEQAIEMYKKAIQLKPDQWQPHYELGIAQYRQKLFSEAALSFQETIKRGESIDSASRIETLARSHYFLGDSYRMSKKFTEAIKAYQEAIKIDDELDLAYFGLGMAYVGLGNSSAARQQYAKLRDMNRDLAAELLAEINKIQLAT